MARTPVTPHQRACKITDAIRSLPLALAQAEGTPVGSPEWERVETLGATIHRNGRFMAGKGKGG